MTKKELIHTIQQKGSCLCVGLDTDISELPHGLPQKPESVLAFNKKIIDVTLEHCVSYKINTAFYEAMGAEGWAVMEETVKHIPDTHFTIADAKRGDIGNTSKKYARAFFEKMNFDAITLHPYMGRDSIEPFMEYPGKWVIILALTSNKGAADFEMQLMKEDNEHHLYEQVISTTSLWGTSENTMYVVGATQSNFFRNIRRLAPDHFLLVPGVGAQGGTVREVIEAGKNSETGLLINVSRGIIGLSRENDFAEKAKNAARAYHDEMRVLLQY